MHQSQSNDKENFKSIRKSKLTASEAISLLAKHGISVSEKEADQIVECINYLAEIAIQQILNSTDQSVE